MSEITNLTISGMTCNRCVTHVDRALRGVPGVLAVEVYLDQHRAQIVHDPRRAPVPDLVEAIRTAGYEARP